MRPNMKNCLLILTTSFVACDSKARMLEHNVAVDTVKYAETGATCEAGFTLEAMHTARCTLPNGAKLYCTTGANGWHCDQLMPPRDAKAEVSRPPTAAPAPPVPALVPAPAP